MLVKNLQFEDGKMIPASKYFSSGESSSVELNEDEMKVAAEIKASSPEEARESQPVVLTLTHFRSSQNIWKGILSNVPVIEDTTDFFKSGAASMDVVR